MASSALNRPVVWLARSGSSRPEVVDEIARALEAAGHPVRVLDHPSQLEEADPDGLFLLEKDQIFALFDSSSRGSRQEDLSRLAAALAHEVSTPLAVSIIATDIVRKEVTSLTGPSGPEGSSTLADALELVARNVARADKLVRGYQRVSLGLLADEREKCSIVEVVSDAIETLGLVMRRSHVSVRTATSLTPRDAEWIGRRGALTQILINLVTNAERYAYPDGKPGTVDITIARNGDELEVTVRDHGAGVSPEHRDQLFMPFFSTGKDRGGSGLGLAILHRLVTRDLGGRVSASFPEDGGTEFRIVLPAECPGAA